MSERVPLSCLDFCVCVCVCVLVCYWRRGCGTVEVSFPVLRALARPPAMYVKPNVLYTLTHIYSAERRWLSADQGHPPSFSFSLFCSEFSISLGSALFD